MGSSPPVCLFSLSKLYELDFFSSPVFLFLIFFLLTLYHPPSQKSTVYGRWKKTSLTAKLLGRATLILRYYVIRVLRIAVAASNHIVRIEFFVETTSASVFFLVFFLALHTDRVKERTVMVM